MIKVNPVFISNEPESQENPTYTVSRLVDLVPQEEVKDEQQVPEDIPTYIAYKAEEGT
jgi:hypothetical protein